MSYSVNDRHYTDHQLRAYLSRLNPGTTVTIQKIGKDKRYGYTLEERLRVIALLQLDLIQTRGYQRKVIARRLRYHTLMLTDVRDGQPRKTAYRRCEALV
jgi:hypothetical protein